MNNSLFLRYFNQWREDPSSIVFVSVADYFLMYGQVEDAQKVCQEGLKHNPHSVAGHMVLVKVHLAKGELKKADAVCAAVLERVPSHSRAQELRTEIDLALRGEITPRAVYKPAEVVEEIVTTVVEDVPIVEDVEIAEDEAVDTTDDMNSAPAWQTVTMAEIYAAQGHHDRAADIYRAILSRDPANEAARTGLDSLGGGN